MMIAVQNTCWRAALINHEKEGANDDLPLGNGYNLSRSLAVDEGVEDVILDVLGISWVNVIGRV